MSHLPVVMVLSHLQLWMGGHGCGRHGHLLVVMMVLLQRGHRNKGQEMFRTGPPRMQEMGRHRRARKQMVGGQISDSQTRTTPGASTSSTTVFSLVSDFSFLPFWFPFSLIFFFLFFVPHTYIHIFIKKVFLASHFPDPNSEKKRG